MSGEGRQYALAGGRLGATEFEGQLPGGQFGGGNFGTRPDRTLGILQRLTNGRPHPET